MPLPAGQLFTQDVRPATPHRLIVQPPRVYPNKPALKLAVQCYDAYGDAYVATRRIISGGR